MKNLIEFSQNEMLFAEYREICDKLTALEKNKKHLREIILKKVADSGDTEIVAGEFKAIVQDQSRENFNIKAAKDALGDKILTPFLSTTTFKKLTVK